MPTILQKLKAMGHKDITYCEEEEPVKRGKAPREKLVDHIQDSINLLEDSSYTIKTVKGKTKTPAACYSILNDTATIRLKYFRKSVHIDNNPGVNIPNSDLLQFLKDLNKLALSGDFDKQLDAIKTDRAKVMKRKK